MKRIKRVHTLDGLVHLFFNRAADDGHRSGRHAFTENGVLYGEGRRDAAAAFLIDATHPDGRPAVVLRANQKWNMSEMTAAVPKAQVAHVVTPHYIHSSVLQPRRVSALFNHFLSTAESYCTKSIDSPGDCEGEWHHNVMRLALQSAKQMLQLKWSNIAEHTRATDALNTFCDTWMVDRTTLEPSREIVRAIAQRNAIDAAAARAFEELRTVYEQWKKDAPLDDYYSVTDSRIAAIARYGFVGPYAQVPRMVRETASRVRHEKRVAELREFLRKEREIASEAYAGKYFSYNVNALPANVQQRYSEYVAIRERVAKRRTNLNAITQLRNAVATATATLAAVPDIVAAFVTEDTGALNNAAQRADAARAAYVDVQKATSNATYYLSPDVVQRHVTPAQREAFDLADSQLQAALQTAKQKLYYARLRAATEDAFAKVEAALADRCPAKANGLLDHIHDRVFAHGSVGGCTNPEVWGDQHAAVIARKDALRARVSEMLQVVTPRDEWINGGSVPMYRSDVGDLMRVTSDGRIRTSRSAVVARRSVKLAMRYVDAQPPGPFTCSVGIDGFTMTHRDTDGMIHVGCHKFSTAEVERIRADIEAYEREQADAVAVVE